MSILNSLGESRPSIGRPHHRCAPSLRVETARLPDRAAVLTVSHSPWLGCDLERQIPNEQKHRHRRPVQNDSDPVGEAQPPFRRGAPVSLRKETSSSPKLGTLRTMQSVNTLAAKSRFSVDCRPPSFAVCCCCCCCKARSKLPCARSMKMCIRMPSAPKAAELPRRILIPASHPNSTGTAAPNVHACAELVQFCRAFARGGAAQCISLHKAEMGDGR